jgi:hypothetical protein
MCTVSEIFEILNVTAGGTYKHQFDTFASQFLEMR